MSLLYRPHFLSGLPYILQQGDGEEMYWSDCRLAEYEQEHHVKTLQSGVCQLIGPISCMIGVLTLV